MENLIQIIKDSLGAVDFANKYIDICNDYPNFDNGQNLKKAEIKKILDSEKLAFKISGNENCFYKDYDFNSFKLRFLVGYKYGFIDALYNFWNNDSTVRILGGFKTHCESIDPNFEKKVKYRFPISTNEHMAKEIILKIIELHETFINEFSKRF